MNKVLLGLVVAAFVAIFSLNLASAAMDFDNVGNYDKNTKELIIKNAFGLGDEIGKAKLISPLIVNVPRGYQKVGEFDLWAYQDYDDVLKNFEIENLKTKKKGGKTFDIRFKSYEEVLVQDKEWICDNPKDWETGDCYWRVVGTHYEQQEKWNKINNTADLKQDDKITIGIFTDVEKGDYKDWKLTIYGVDAPWAIWTEGMNSGLVSYYDGESANDSLGKNNGTFINQAGVSAGGIIGNALTFDGSGDHLDIVSADPVFNISKPTTINLWVYADVWSAQAEGQALFGDSEGSGTGTAFRVKSTGQNPDLQLYSVEPNNFAMPSAMGTSRWYMLTVIKNSTGVAMYVNGTKFGSNTNTGTALSNAHVFEIGSSGTIDSADHDGLIDEVGIWNRSLLETEISDLWNEGVGLTYTDIFEYRTANATFSSPDDNYYNTTDNTVNLQANFTGNLYNNITSVSVLVYDRANNLDYSNTDTGSYGVSYNKTDWNTGALTDDTYKWAVYMYGDGGLNASTDNRTFIIDLTSPVVNLAINLTNITTTTLPINSSFLYNVSDTHLASCYYNSTQDTAYIIITCNTTAYNNISWTTEGTKNIQYCANDSLGLETCRVDSILVNYFTSQITDTPNPVAEGRDVVYTLRINMTSIPTTTSYLVLNNTRYNATTTQAGTNHYNFSRTVTIPNGWGSSTGNNISYHWNYSIVGITTDEKTSYANTTVWRGNLSYCNAANPIPFIVFKYKDEVTNNPINATIYSSLWNYTVVGAGVTQTSSYSSPDNVNTSLNHSFCFTHPSFSITTNLNYQYGDSNEGYSTKTWPLRATTLSNATSTYTLYLINLVDSGTTPVTFQAIDSQTSAILENIRIRTYRDISGTSTVVNDGYTDATGTVSYYMSPVTSYQIVATGTGCTQLTSSITPTSNQYNILLSCVTSSSGFTSKIDGISFHRTPADGVSVPGTTDYKYYILSNVSDMSRVKFSLYDATKGTELASNNSLTNTTACSTSECLLSLTYTTYTGDNIKGRYWVAINGTADSDLILLEADSYWRYIVINQNNSLNSMGRLMINIQDLFNSWGESTPNCLPYNTEVSCTAVAACKWINQTGWYPSESVNYREENALCVARDDLNKIEFNRIVFIFFGFTVFLFILGKTTGYELNHPGSFIIGMSAVIWIFSLYGMFTFAGLTSSDFFNQYIFALATSSMGLGYSISVIRRYS